MKDILNKLIPGNKYTIALVNDFGFPSGFNFTYIKGEVQPYAQYKESLCLYFKKPRQRNVRGLRLLPLTTFVIWEGTHQPDTKIFKEGQSVSYCSFDNQYIVDALNSVKEKPIVIHNLNEE